MHVAPSFPPRKAPCVFLRQRRATVHGTPEEAPLGTGRSVPRASFTAWTVRATRHCELGKGRNKVTYHPRSNTKVLMRFF